VQGGALLRDFSAGIVERAPGTVAKLPPRDVLARIEASKRITRSDSG
jgi:hypothetical protein